MDSDRLNRWLALGANIGVLIGIILVVIELDQNRDMMRSQIRYQVFQDEANYNMSVATNRQLVELVLRARQGDEMDGTDSVQNFIRLLSYFRIQENIHYQYRQGLLDDTEYEGIKIARRGFVGVSRATARAWCVIRRGTSPEFMAEMDQSFVDLNCEQEGLVTAREANGSAVPANGIDHLIYASADLKRGMDEIESLLGVRPVIGGRHPQYGTHNALLSLGGGVYLEVIARDPELPAPDRGALVDLPQGSESTLLTWVQRSADIEQAAAAAQDAGVGIGNVGSGSRTRPDGAEIKWQLTDPYALPMGGAVPFLIHWGETSHPSTVIPEGGRLVELVIEHPESESVRSALSTIGADVTVAKGSEYRLSARIETADGMVVLQ